LIIRIAAEPAGFDQGRFAAGELPPAHRRLLDLWREVGTLAEPRRSDVEALPQNVRKWWLKAVKRERLLSGEAAIRLGEAATLDAAQVIGGIDLACLSPDRAAQWGVFNAKRSSYQVSNAAIELCSISHCDQSSVAKEARRKARAPIRAGQTPTAVWDERFQPIVSCCLRQVVVMDRYCLADARGLRFVLDRFCVDLPETASVDVYSSVDTPEARTAHSQLVEEFRPRWAKRGGSLRFIVASGSSFGSIRHDRYIRVDHTVCDIGRGLAIFWDPSVQQETSFHMRPESEETQTIEERLRRCSQCQTISDSTGGSL
jgi:hypothetical protein